MLRIKNLDVRTPRNDEIFGLFMRVLNLAVASLASDVDKTIVAQFKAAVEAFDAALKQSVKNSHTATVKAADELVDHLYTGLTLYLRALTYHPVPGVVTAAEQVLDIIDKYGKLTDLPYNQQYGALHNSLQELNALPEETVTQLDMGEWMAALTQAVAQFSMARDAQTYEQSEYSIGLVKDTRAAAEQAYKTFVDAVNAFAAIFGEEGYAGFIGQVNVMIDDLNAELKARKTRAENEKKKEEENKDESGEMKDESGTTETPENSETPETPETPENAEN